MRDQGPRQEVRWRAEERIAELRRELLMGEACSGPELETWRVVEEELLDELAELELSLLAEEPGPLVCRGHSPGEGKEADRSRR